MCVTFIAQTMTNLSPVIFVPVLPWAIFDSPLLIRGSSIFVDDGEPGFLYEVERPLLSVDGTIQSNYFVAAWYSNVYGPTLQKDTVVLSTSYWRFDGTAMVGDPPNLERVSYTGLPNVPFVVPQESSGNFVMFSFYGRNNVAGKLAKVRYVTDGNQQFVMRMDASNASAVGNEILGVSAVENLPGNLRPRYLLAEQVSDITVRRKIPIGAGNNEKYLTGGNITLETVTGNQTFRITGRVGEKVSF